MRDMKLKRTFFATKVNSLVSFVALLNKLIKNPHDLLNRFFWACLLPWSGCDRISLLCWFGTVQFWILLVFQVLSIHQMEALPLLFSPRLFQRCLETETFHFESECNFAILCILHFIFLSLDQIASFSFFVMLNEKLLNFVTGKVAVPVLISDNQLVFSFS